MATQLTNEIIESAISALSIQGRVMLRLLLLQYLDLSQEDVDYMAADRPDPRFVAGAKPLVPIISRETIQGLMNRVAQYRAQTRQKREQIWLQIDCLQKQIAYGEALCVRAERLLRERFGADDATLKTWHAQARSAIAKPAIRELDRLWEKGEIAEDEYLRKRLGIEYQAEIRKLDRERKRLESTRRDYNIASHASLQDHEIAHIWGIPSGTLVARKAKFLHQYLQGLQAALPQRDQLTIDLWKETFNVLSSRPVERSTIPYDGLDRTEASLMERLTMFALKAMPEEFESRAWQAISQSLFALQRLSAIQNERDMDSTAIEQVLLQRSMPAPREPAEKPEAETASPAQELNEMSEHVLRSMKGEEHRHLNGLLFLILMDIIASCIA